MQLSLRPQMIAGVAALSAAAVTIPLAQSATVPALPKLSSAVQLSALDSPISALVQTTSRTIDSLFNSYSLLNPFTDLYWPDSYYSPDFDIFYGPGYVGAIPNAVNQFSFGPLSALINNLSNYTQAALDIPLSLVQGVSDAAINTPGAVIAAVGYLAAGDPASALAVLQSEIVAPLQTQLQYIAYDVGYIVDNVIGNATSLLTVALPAALATVGSAISGGLNYLVSYTAEAVGLLISDIAAGDFQTAWNFVANGFLGPDGLLGAISDLTVGIGLADFEPYENPDGSTTDILTVYAPSVRSALNSALQRLGDYRSLGLGGILNEPWDPVVTASSAAVAPARNAAATTAVPAGSSADSAAVTADAPAATPKNPAKGGTRHASVAKTSAAKAGAAKTSAARAGAAKAASARAAAAR